jgi:NAD(P)-dependent dehydrogenase (short-subunit alcohol dehydrogenase family)
MSTLQQFDIRGRSALVTGAASGIGLAYAEAMAEAGASVTLTDIDADGLDREVERLRAEGHMVQGVTTDVGDCDAVRAAFDAHDFAYGGCDIAFANAGIDPGAGFVTPEGERVPEGQIDNLDIGRWDRSIRINLTGVFYTIREAARVMKATGRGGSIIATSSNAAIVNEPMVGMAYMPAKAGVAHLVRQTALELAAFRIRVNAIAPGPVVTNIGGGWIKKDPAVRRAWDQRVPLGRVAETEQIKPLALYLASDASSYVTGAHILIDGGMSLGRLD